MDHGAAGGGGAAPGMPGEEPRDDVENMRAIFNMFDHDGMGEIAVADLGEAMRRLNRDPSEGERFVQEVDPEGRGRITFEQFVDLLERSRNALPDEGPDPKVLEFLRILEEYRIKCEAEGNYLEAERAVKQSDTLRKQEQKRQLKALKARHAAEREDVQLAHTMQYKEFLASWDKYLEDYDETAQKYIRQMTEKQATKLREFQVSLNEELAKKPPKYSRELLEWRRRQELLAKQRKYAEAQRIKRVGDELEKRERAKMDESRVTVFQAREDKYRAKQQTELAALLKRIQIRRQEHLKQRDMDTQRLLQRNKNVQQVLLQKQAAELNTRKREIKLALAEPIQRAQAAAREAKKEAGATVAGRFQQLRTKGTVGSGASAAAK